MDTESQRSGPGQWLLVAFLPAIVTVICSGFLYLQNQAQADLQRKIWTQDFVVGMVDQRINAMQAEHSALAEANRLSVVYASAGENGQKTITRLLHCSDAENRTKDPENCQEKITDVQLLKALDDYSALSGRFAAARATATALFCEKTAEALKSIPKGMWWWNVSEAAKTAATDAMGSEVLCGFDEITKSMRQ